VTLKYVMWFFFQLNNDVTGFTARFVVSVTVEEEFVSTTNALIDLDLKYKFKPDYDARFLFESGIFNAILNF